MSFPQKGNKYYVKDYRNNGYIVGIKDAEKQGIV